MSEQDDWIRERAQDTAGQLDRQLFKSLHNKTPMAILEAFGREAMASGWSGAAEMVAELHRAEHDLLPDNRAGQFTFTERMLKELRAEAVRVKEAGG